jgi:hypothetical protein
MPAKDRLRPLTECDRPQGPFSCLLNRHQTYPVGHFLGHLGQRSPPLEQQLVHVPVGVGRGAGAAGGARADDEGALHPGAVLADRVDLAVVHAGHRVGLSWLGR